MGMLRLVEQGDHYAQYINFPDFYMNDFSVMGIVVGKLDEAMEVLMEKGITAEEEKDGMWVFFQDNGEMRAILAALASNHIEYSVSDLVSCAYQG